MIKRNESTPAYVALISVQVFFGTLAVIGKVVLTVIPPVALVGFRVGITALVLTSIQTIRGRVWLKNKSDYWRLALLSFVAVTFNQLLFVTGLSLTKAANTSLLAVTIPIFTVAIGSVLGLEKLKKIKIVGIVFAAAGVVFLIDPRNASFSSQTTIGDTLVILNSLSYGIYVATSKKIVTRNGALRSTMWIFIFAAIICVPLGAVSFSAVEASAISASFWLLILYVGIFATAIPYLLNAWALARVNPSTVAVFIYMQPLIGFLLAVAFLGEHIDFKFAVAAALIFAGVFLVVKKFTPINT